MQILIDILILIHRSFVRSSLALIQASSFARSRTLKPTLNFFGSSVRAVFVWLHSRQSRIGSSSRFFAGTMWNALIRRRKAV